MTKDVSKDSKDTQVLIQLAIIKSKDYVELSDLKSLEKELEHQTAERDKYFLTTQKFLWTIFAAVPSAIVIAVGVVTLIHHY